MPNPPNPDLCLRLSAFDSAAIANAIDALGSRLANEGFADSRISCRTPRLNPMVGQVVTLKVRSSDPPMKRTFYLDQPDWWERLPPGSGPRVLAIEDVDHHPGRGACVGPVHACVLRALGFAGVMTNGAVRGVRRFQEVGLHAFSGNLSPAHAYSHVVALGEPVEIAGLKLREGDLVHGDGNGVVQVPAELAEQVATTAVHFQDRENHICDYCRSPGFSLAELRRRAGFDPSRR